MKRLVIILTVTLLVVSGKLYAATNDLFGTGPNSEFRIDVDGNPVTAKGIGFDITWIDIPSSSSQTFTGTAGATISTATLVSAGTTFVDGATYASGINTFLQITSPRNIVCDIGFLYGESTTTANGTLTISGIDNKFVTTTETLSVSTGTAAADGVGVKAWNWIDSFAFSGFTISGACGQAQDGGSATGISTCTIHIGVGSKIGFAYDITASTDVAQVTIDYVNYSTASYTLNGVNTTNDTIDLSLYGNKLIPNGARDYRIRGTALKNH